MVRKLSFPSALALCASFFAGYAFEIWLSSQILWICCSIETDGPDIWPRFHQHSQYISTSLHYLNVKLVFVCF